MDREDVVCMYNEILLLFSRSVMSDSLQPIRLQHARLPCPSLSQSLVKLMSIESVMPSNHLILCHPLLLLPSVFPSTRVFSNESVLHIRWLRDWKKELEQYELWSQSDIVGILTPNTYISVTLDESLEHVPTRFLIWRQILITILPFSQMCFKDYTR